ncbi:MAG: DUF5660 family protein [Patescibacteria group bacterium]
MTNKLTQKGRKETIKDPYETEDGIVSQIKNTARQELSQDWKIAMQQMLGVKESNAGEKASGDLNEGEEVIFPKKEKKVDVEPGIDYFREIIHAETKISQRNEAHLETKIQEIVVELKKLSESSKELQLEFKDITVATLPVKPGKYHLNFFEWMLITIQNARMRVEDSAAWIGVISGKKGKKDYWTLVKSHGTSFMLSGERVTATQTG